MSARRANSVETRLVRPGAIAKKILLKHKVLYDNLSLLARTSSPSHTGMGLYLMGAGSAPPMRSFLCSSYSS